MMLLRRKLLFGTAAAVCVFCAPLLSLAETTASEEIRITPPGGAAADTATSACREFIAGVVDIWRTGETTRACEMLSDYVTTSGAEDAAAVKLRLAYQRHSMGDKEAAKGLFLELASLEPGVNDSVRGEAAFRLAHMLPRDQQLALYHRIVSGELRVPNYSSCEATLMCAIALHKGGRLKDALRYYEAVVSGTVTAKQRIQAQVQCAGLWFELAKGEGKQPIAQGDIPGAYERARQYCDEVTSSTDTIPQDRVMVAALMHMETHYFQSDFERAYEESAAFLDRWGSDPSAYESVGERKYINAAKYFHMQNCFITGRNQEARTYAGDALTSPPTVEEQFANTSNLVYALAIDELLDFGQQGLKSGSSGRSARRAGLAAKTGAGSEPSGEYLDMVQQALSVKRAQASQGGE